MSNLFDYLAWRGDLEFTRDGFNIVDSLILCRLSYLPFGGILPEEDSDDAVLLSEAARQFTAISAKKNSKINDEIILKEDPRFLAELGKTKRFGGLRLSRYVNIIDIEEEKQFSAVTIMGDGILPYISFRGTDNTLVGWKEDFNMSFMDSIPSQLEAVEYLEKTAAALRGRFRVGGHSKGGNLAVYASSFSRPKTQRRIPEIYNFDGPGFNEKIIASAGYNAVRDRIQTYLPQSSVIGMLFEHENNYTVVRSTQSGLMQHDMYSWEILGNDLIRLNSVDNNSKFVDKTLKHWIDSLEPSQRREFSDGLYELLCSTDAKTVPELSASWVKKMGAMIKTISDVDDATRKRLMDIIHALFRSARENIKELWPREKKDSEKENSPEQSKEETRQPRG
ncbi:DUF2974 domain-containing protein [Breznakiella homolactica]|uniref:DUF2974 domain-containing protein n=1 Tax=Breznakiella homolactica TaxID=2798577 RepID=A0A7T8BBM6_9SPIR|nr:DUF2974 domain-containing protein [Breznakiella homolactica]QQO10727.1 DUF2974 domain-containing protein [Breznakiella homolactica]